MILLHIICARPVGNRAPGTWQLKTGLLASSAVRSRAFKYTAIAILILMFPGSVELVEDGIHWITDGHTTHDTSTEHHREGPADEHGCSGPYHICICHSSSPFITRAAPADPGKRALRSCEMIELVDAPSPSSHLDRLFRPPAA